MIFCAWIFDDVFCVFAKREMSPFLLFFFSMSCGWKFRCFFPPVGSTSSHRWPCDCNENSQMEQQHCTGHLKLYSGAMRSEILKNYVGK